MLTVTGDSKYNFNFSSSLYVRKKVVRKYVTSGKFDSSTSYVKSMADPKYVGRNDEGEKVYQLNFFFETVCENMSDSEDFITLTGEATVYINDFYTN